MEDTTPLFFLSRTFQCASVSFTHKLYKERRQPKLHSHVCPSTSITAPVAHPATAYGHHPWHCALPHGSRKQRNQKFRTRFPALLLSGCGHAGAVHHETQHAILTLHQLVFQVAETLDVRYRTLPPWSAEPPIRHCLLQRPEPRRDAKDLRTA